MNDFLFQYFRNHLKELAHKTAMRIRIPRFNKFILKKQYIQYLYITIIAALYYLTLIYFNVKNSN